MEFELCKHVMENEKKRAAYDALAKEVFGLSFEAWYKNGFWSDTNQPYTLFVLDGGENIFSGDRLYFPELSHT